MKCAKKWEIMIANIVTSEILVWVAKIMMPKMINVNQMGVAQMQKKENE